MKRVLVTVVIIVMIIGCASAPPATQEDKVKEFPGKEKAALFEAASNALFEMGLQIQNSDKDAGIINATKTPTGMTAAVVLGPQPTMKIHYDIMVQDSKVKVRIYVQDGTARTEGSKPGYDEFWANFEV